MNVKRGLQVFFTGDLSLIDALWSGRLDKIDTSQVIALEKNKSNYTIQNDSQLLKIICISLSMLVALVCSFHIT